MHNADAEHAPYDPAIAADLLAHFREHRPEWKDATIADVRQYCEDQARDYIEMNPSETITAGDMLANAFDNHSIGAEYCSACD